MPPTVMKLLEEEEFQGKEFAPLRFEVLMREPSEDVRLAFGEGQMTVLRRGRA